MLAHSRRTSEAKHSLGTVKKITKLINIPALAIRRKLKWIATLMHSKKDIPSKDVHFKMKEWFEPWLFGLTWEEAIDMSKDDNEWEEYIEECIHNHALPIEIHASQEVEEKEA